MALNAKPNSAHYALAELARRETGLSDAVAECGWVVASGVPCGESVEVAAWELV